MNKYLRHLTMYVILFCLLFTSCVTRSEQSPISTVESHPTPFPTATLIPAYTLTSAPPSTGNFTATPYQIVFPSVTMTSQQAEDALLELLKTNGNCTGKCIAGIQPDTMTIQEMVDKMAQWGVVEIYENPDNGNTYINLVRNPLDGDVIVDLSIGTPTQKMINLDNVFMHISGPLRDSLVGEDVWGANYDNWEGVRWDNLLKAYGVPSYVGYFFQTTVEVGTPLEGRTISYTMLIQYEEMNLVVGAGELAYTDGDRLFLCPSKDPHGLAIEINPESSFEKGQEYASVTWQALTGTDLDAFYQLFTKDPGSCITTTLEQILTLQPSFR